MRIRPTLLVAGVFAALLPFSGVAQAATNDQVIAQQRAAAMTTQQQINLANDVARCQMAAAGEKVPGTVGQTVTDINGMVISCTPGAMTTTGNQSSMSGTTSSGSSMTNASGTGCVTATRSLTKAETNIVNAWAIAVQKAISKKQPAPTLPSDVAALVGAC